MDLDRPLATISSGGIALLVVGAVITRLVGWPPASVAPAGGVSVSTVAAVAVAALLVVAVAVAVWWGVSTAPGDDETPYWGF